MQVEVFRQNYWGKFRFYPLNEMAKTLCKLLSQKTLTDANIQVLKESKFEIIIKND